MCTKCERQISDLLVVWSSNLHGPARTISPLFAFRYGTLDVGNDGVGVRDVVADV